MKSITIHFMKNNAKCLIAFWITVKIVPYANMPKWNDEYLIRVFDIREPTKYQFDDWTETMNSFLEIQKICVNEWTTLDQWNCMHFQRAVYIQNCISTRDSLVIRFSFIYFFWYCSESVACDVYFQCNVFLSQVIYSDENGIECIQCKAIYQIHILYIFNEIEEVRVNIKRWIQIAYITHTQINDNTREKIEKANLKKR